MERLPPLGTPEFFAACAEADRHITAGDGKKPHIPRSKKPKGERPKSYPKTVKARAIELMRLFPLKGKSAVSAQVYRELKVYVEPNLISQWMVAHKKAEKKNVEQKA